MNNKIKFGLFLGLASAALTLIFQDILHVDPNGFSKYTAWIILFAGIFLGTKAWRDNEKEGFITYGNALGAGVLIALVSGIVIGVFMMVYVTVINTGFIDQILEASEKSMRENNQPEDQIEMAMEWTRKFTTPIWITLFSVIGNVFLGFLISLITAAILQKKKPEEGNFI